jgi:hypothetical protein
MAPIKRTMSDIKNKLMNPATTTHFECIFTPPESVRDFMRGRASAGAGVILTPDVMDKINLSCHDASLPGSSLQTATLTDSYTGVNENYAYRRAYDNRADFTFYVDHTDNGKSSSQNYTVILFFENWISYTSNEKFADPNNTDPRPGMESPNYFYRMNFPDTYLASKITINKFEKDYAGGYLQYDFINSFPISIASMPVSYDAAQVLKCTVSFSYQRYTVKRSTLSAFTPPLPATSTNANAPGVPELRTNTINLNSPVINDVDGNTFPFGPGIPIDPNIG